MSLYTPYETYSEGDICFLTPWVNGLIFPSETPDYYFGDGLLYAMGQAGERPYRYYYLYAEFRNGREKLALEMVDRRFGIYRVSIPGIGNFNFIQRSVSRMRLAYIGSSQALEGKVATREFRCLNEELMEQACRSSGFYLTGYSEILPSLFD